jgi:nucleotide-binding universal stress UspA family protein
MAGAGPSVPSAEDDVEDSEWRVVEQAVSQLRAAGINAHGELVNATEHDIADVILQRAKELDIDVIVLGHQHHRGAGDAFGGSVAAQVIRQHPPCSILLARPPER